MKIRSRYCQEYVARYRLEEIGPPILVSYDMLC